MQWQSGYATSTPQAIPLCFGVRHYDYNIPYDNADDVARSADRRYAYTRTHPLPGSAAGAIPHWPQPAPSDNPSALEKLLRALSLGSVLYEVQQEIYTATSDDSFER
ncbi:MAG: hypothetical protein JJU03_04155 [Idiomarina sp.]|nr:hypothetical protein [Idiomarina sp.]